MPRSQSLQMECHVIDYFRVDLRDRNATRARTTEFGGRAYLQIVESRREGDAGLPRSGGWTNAMMLSAVADDAAIKIAVRRIGPTLAFERCGKRSAAAP